jgi:hypothetical protein
MGPGNECRDDNLSVARAQKAGRVVHSSGGLWRAAVALSPIVTLGLDPRVHRAAAPRLSGEIRSLSRPWIAGTSPAMTV